MPQNIKKIVDWSISLLNMVGKNFKFLYQIKTYIKNNIQYDYIGFIPQIQGQINKDKSIYKTYQISGFKDRNHIDIAVIQKRLLVRLSVSSQ